MTTYPPVCITVQPVNPREWILTSPDLPGWQITATSPIQLGLRLRDGYGHITRRLAHLDRIRSLQPATHEAHLCPQCGTIVTRQRTYLPPSPCPDCRSTRHLQVVTSA